MVLTINCLGHSFGERTVTPVNEEIQAVLSIEETNKLHCTNEFLGALSWYRKFIPNFASFCCPNSCSHKPYQ